MVIALAGRRVDASDAAQPNFPPGNVANVREQIREFLQTHGAQALVCAAACGADLLGLEAAAESGLRRRVVLPFDRATFRTTSVIDRGGDWGERYDRVIAEVAATGDLVELAHDKDDPQTYFTGNQDILDEAKALAAELNTDICALVVWNGKSRGPDDVSGHFKQQAEIQGMSVAEVTTLPVDATGGS